VEFFKGEVMRNIFALLLITALLASCAGKSSTTDGKKNKPVISVFDNNNATPEQKNSKAAADVLDSPRFIPSQQPTTNAAGEVDKNSPKEVIISYTAELQKIQDDTSAKGENRDKQISEKVRKFFDFGGLARLSLGSNWNKLTPKKQKEFSDLFTGLIEKSYLRRSKNPVGNYQLSYGNEKINGDQATVACQIYKEDVDLEVTYDLHKVSGTWMIYNVAFDQVNLLKNYQTQFNALISKSGVDGLMTTMRKKLKESSEVDSAL
jgi:phospholipid transport system substrate-binding protein